MCVGGDCGCGCNEVITKRGLQGERGPAGPTGPQGPSGGGTILDENVIDAIDASNDPSGVNPFATMNDIDALGGIEININFVATPLSSGSSFLVSTSLPINSCIYDLALKGTGLDGDIINVGFETDHEDYLSELTSDVNLTSIKDSASFRTTVINRNIKVTAIGASITSGTLKIILKTI